jgi:hypothetical protein
MSRPTLGEYEIEQARVRRMQDQAADAYDRKYGDDVVPLEPCRIPGELRTPATLGLAGRARAAGCEDAYDNAMEARYGEGW